MRYFSNFPVTNYANNLVKNIFTRVRISDNITDYSHVFYPYENKEKERMDMIAYDYYEDQYNDWIIYFTNKIIDPYYDLYLSQEDFDNYIIQKYGSITKAQTKILGYRNNWYLDEQTLTLSGYNALPANLKKYWTPIVSENNISIGYERSPSDVTLTTNKVLSLTTTFNTGNSFTIDERVTLMNGSLSVANGTVSFSNSSITVVRHIEGTFSNNSSYYLSGATSNAAINTVTTINSNIDDTEVVYYTSYSAFDYENELNESKKSIKLLDNRYAATVERQLRNLLNP